MGTIVGAIMGAEDSIIITSGPCRACAMQAVRACGVGGEWGGCIAGQKGFGGFQYCSWGPYRACAVQAVMAQCVAAVHHAGTVSHNSTSE